MTEQNDTLKLVVSGLGETSTLHGIPKIVSSRSRVIKILWCILLLGAIYLFSIQLHELCDEYYKFPTKTAVRIKYGPLPFPAVTFCNMNPVKVTITKYVHSFYVLYWVVEKQEMLKYMTVTDAITGKLYNDFYNSFNNTWERFDGWKSRLLTDIQNISLQDRIEYGHQLEDFILAATFAGRLLSPQSFVTTSSHVYGNCFTLDIDDLIAKGSGHGNSLYVVFNIEKPLYLEELTSSYGVRVVLHEKGTYPLPEQDGITLSTNYETEIGIRKKTIRRMGGKYGNCTDGEYFKEKYNMSYTVSLCYTICKVENVLSECGCRPIYTFDFMGVANPLCDYDNDSSCLDSVNAKVLNGTIQCGCDSRCEENVFTTTLSGRKWPHKRFLSKVLLRETCRRNLTLLENACSIYDSEFDALEGLTQEEYDKINDNFLAVNIYFEDLHSEVISEDPLYNPVRFLSDIGGAMGLYIGASALTLVEILQLLLEIILLCRRKWMGQTQVAKPEQDN